MTYKAVPVPVNGTVLIRGSRVGGFIAATGGTIQFTLRKGPVTTDLPAVPLAAGQEWDIEFFSGTDERSTVTLAGGCSGVLFYT